MMSSARTSHKAKFGVSWLAFKCHYQACLHLQVHDNSPKSHSSSNMLPTSSHQGPSSGVPSFTDVQVLTHIVIFFHSFNLVSSEMKQWIAWLNKRFMIWIQWRCWAPKTSNEWVTEFLTVGFMLATSRNLVERIKKLQQEVDPALLVVQVDTFPYKLASNALKRTQQNTCATHIR